MLARSLIFVSLGSAIKGPKRLAAEETPGSRDPLSRNVASRRENEATPRHTGVLWYVSAILLGLALAGLYSARTSDFIHGEELAWFLAYFGPLALTILSFIFASIHLARGRLSSLRAWLPVVVSLMIFAWLVAYLYFDKFRS